MLGLTAMCQTFVRHWATAELPGNIVNVSSMAAVFGLPGECIHYAGSKAAVDSFTIVAGQRVCTTPHSRQRLVARHHRYRDPTHCAEPGRAARVAANIPTARPGQAQEVAEAVVWLLSIKASYAPGTVLTVAGGV